MNQLCKVCGEPAAGYHFGAFTCEGCKSFFGRTYNNLSALGECKNNGECVINKKNRTSCKSCRLKKCLMVGMSKSGSRYGRRSNWFKIHCLIQDQQEMSNRMAEQGHLSNKSDVDDLSSKLTESSKDFLVKYKENELRQSLANSQSMVGAGSHHGGHHSLGGSHSDLNQSHHVISPRLTSPNSSDGSIGRANIPSPYSALFEGAKVPAFASPYLPSNNNIHAGDFQKEFNSLASRFNPVSGVAGLPMTPISPLSPLNAAVSRLFLQNTSAILGKRFSELQKLQNEQLLNSASRFLPLHTLNTVLKPAAAAAAAAAVVANNKEVADEVSNGMQEYYADLPEQEGPIDLSTKRIAELNELILTAVNKCSKPVPGDHDSGFSPSSNEDTHNTSPLDLTAKPQKSGLTGIGGSGLRLSRVADIVVDVEHDDEDDDDDHDVDVDDDDDNDDGMDEVMMGDDVDHENDDDEMMRDDTGRRRHGNDNKNKNDHDEDDEDADISDIEVQVDVDEPIRSKSKSRIIHNNNNNMHNNNNKNKNSTSSSNSSSNNNNNNNSRQRDSRRQIECLP